MLRLWHLWADAARQTIQYPMDKIKDPARIQEAMVADAILDYVRTNRLPQKDLDTMLVQDS
ncbi:hypothetical protein ACOZB2_23835 [Pantoea endophytica]